MPYSVQVREVPTALAIPGHWQHTSEMTYRIGAGLQFCPGRWPIVLVWRQRARSIAIAALASKAVGVPSTYMQANSACWSVKRGSKRSFPSSRCGEFVRRYANAARDTMDRLRGAGVRQCNERLRCVAQLQIPRLGRTLLDFSGPKERGRARADTSLRQGVRVCRCPCREPSPRPRSHSSGFPRAAGRPRWLRSRRRHRVAQGP